jgi:hypothetical protein
MTTKTIAINGNRYTAARIIKLAESPEAHTDEHGTTWMPLPCGAEIAIHRYSDGSIGVRNYGGAQRKGNQSLGGLIAVLA